MDFEDIGDAFDRKSFVSYARTRAAEQEERDPVVGDSVHFWDGVACRAAIVTQDDLDSVWLSFLMPGELTWRPVREVLHDEHKGENTYHWPEAQ